MKPQNTVLIVLACVGGVALSVALSLALIAMMPVGQQPPRFVFNNDVPFAAAGDVDNVAGMPPAARAQQPCPPEALATLRGPVAASKDCTVSGPFTHANLSLYLIQGSDSLKETNILTLQEALNQNLAFVHEGSIAVDNRSKSLLFIQGGDIIKGGCQDRVLPYDQLIPPETNRVPVDAFCVEAGRSSPRGQELSTGFQSANEQLPGKRLHLAARHLRSQQHVWDAVRQTQTALTQNLGGSVQHPQSQTSLQLTLETQRVDTALDAFFDRLGDVPGREKNVIGIAVAINGQFQGAEIYASAELFQRLWPKLLRSNAVAAVAERRSKAAAPRLSAEAVQALLADIETGAAHQQPIGARTLLIRQETPRGLLFDTCDTARQNVVVHRSFLAK